MSLGLLTRGMVIGVATINVQIGNIGYIDIEINQDEYNIEISY